MKLKRKEKIKRTTWNLRGNIVETAPPNKGLSENESADMFNGQKQKKRRQKGMVWLNFLSENFVEGAVFLGNLI